MACIASLPPGHAQTVEVERQSHSAAKASDELGLALLKQPNRGFEALWAFQRATQLDPTDAGAFYHVGLAYMTLMTRGPVAEHPYADRARAAFERALELNPQHPDAGYQLGRLYEGMAGGSYIPSQSDSFSRIGRAPGASEASLDAAVIAYARQLTTNPNHRDAIHALGLLQSRRGYHEQACALLQILVDHQPLIDPDLLRDLALTYWRAHNWARARETFDRLIPMLPDDERRLFRDVSLVATQEETDRIAQASGAAQDSLWQAFWASRDVNPLTTENERLIEHYARVAYARRAFGQGQWPWDRRGEIVIRYGLPDQVFQGQTTTGFAGEGERTGLGETWTYTHLPMTLTFENTMYSGRYDYPPIFAEWWVDSSGAAHPKGIDPAAYTTHPYFVSRRVIKKTPEQHIPRELGRPLAFVQDVVAFRTAGGHPQLEVAYGIPAADSSLDEGSGTGQALQTGVVLYGNDWRRITADSSQAALFVLSSPPSAGDRVAIQRVEAPPGDYQMAVQVHDRAGRRFGVQQRPIQVPSFAGQGLKMSGIRLASDIRPSGGQPGMLARSGVRVVPNPSRTYHRGEPVYLYVELYDLTLSQSGQGHYQVALSVSTDVDQRQDYHPVWRVLSRVEKLFQREHRGTITMTVEGTSRDATEAWHTAIDTAELAAGVYTLRVAVTDLSTTQQVTQEQLFWVK
ncbi:MAG: GWxTD domain-containing protein [Candidatus Latescibacteria bacterium]|nr:GWxTD domain-containing protein [Candidatus Latescibacterota bacterium]